MSSVSTSQLQDIRALYDVSLAVNYTQAASAAILFFDYFLTFNRELELIWKRRRSVFTVLFLFTRYLPFIDTFGLLVYRSSPGVTGRGCTIQSNIQQILIILSILAGEGILLARTAAVWGNSKRIFWGLFAFMMLCACGAILLTVLYDSDTSGAPTSPLIQEAVVALLGICVTNSKVATESSAVKSVAPWIIVLVFETVTVCLILPKALLGRHSAVKTDLYVAVYMKGIGYYLCTLAVSVVNIVVVLSPQSSGFRDHVFAELDRIMHTIIACRLVFSIRGAVYDTPQTNLSSVEFYLPGSRHESMDESTVQYVSKPGEAV